MGLDMYLKKSKKVEGFTANDYDEIDDYLSDDVDSETNIQQLDLEQATGINGANALKSEIKLRGEFIHWYSILEEVGYWRKANQIHAWFVEKVQGGEDECQLSLVSKEQLEELFETVKIVKENKEKAEQLLPTRSGFFFGHTEYDEWYERDIDETIRILTDVFQNTNFDEEVIFYRSSW